MIENNQTQAPTPSTDLTPAHKTLRIRRNLMSVLENMEFHGIGSAIAIVEMGEHVRQLLVEAEALIPAPETPSAPASA